MQKGQCDKSIQSGQGIRHILINSQHEWFRLAFAVWPLRTDSERLVQNLFKSLQCSQDEGIFQSFYNWTKMKTQMLEVPKVGSRWRTGLEALFCAWFYVKPFKYGISKSPLSNLWHRNPCYPHCTDEKSEAQTGCETHPKSQSQEATELGSESRWAWFQAQAVSTVSELQQLLNVSQSWHRPCPSNL